jgi:hypothetical protein
MCPAKGRQSLHVKGARHVGVKTQQRARYTHDVHVDESGEHY